MTRTEIVAVAIRLLAVWLFVQALATTAAGVAYARYVLQSFVQLALLLLASALTWKFSVALARRTLPQSDPGDPVVPLSSREIERMTLRVLGVFLVVAGLSGLGQTLTYAQIIAETSGRGTWLGQPSQPDIVSLLVRYGIQLVAGLLLFLGKTGLRRVLAVVRGEGDIVSSALDESVPSSDDPAEREKPGNSRQSGQRPDAPDDPPAQP